MEINIYSLEKRTKSLNKIKNSIEKTYKKSGKYEEDFMKIQFDSNGDLPSNTILKLYRKQ